METLRITSPLFEDNTMIPARYTCDGENISPSLQISGVPKEANSLVFVVDDPDAVGGRVWEHWLVWNINPNTILIESGEVPSRAVEGTTSFGTKRYGGPCPPTGSGPHHYCFKLYALDTMLNLPSSADKKEIEKAMMGHILDQTLLTGVYEKK